MNLLNERLTRIRMRKKILGYEIKEETDRVRLQKLIGYKNELEDEEKKILKELGVS